VEREAAERMVRLIKKICRRGTICSVDRNTFGPCGDLLYNSHTTFSCSAHLNLSPAQKRGPFFGISRSLDVDNTITVQNCTGTVVIQKCYLARSGSRRGVSCLQQHTPCNLRDPPSPAGSEPLIGQEP